MDPLETMIEKLYDVVYDIGAYDNLAGEVPMPLSNHYHHKVDMLTEEYNELKASILSNARWLPDCTCTPDHVCEACQKGESR